MGSGLRRKASDAADHDRIVSRLTAPAWRLHHRSSPWLRYLRIHRQADPRPTCPIIHHETPLAPADPRADGHQQQTRHPFAGVWMIPNN
jgi:hypothetical protein